MDKFGVRLKDLERNLAWMVFIETPELQRIPNTQKSKEYLGTCLQAWTGRRRLRPRRPKGPGGAHQSKENEDTAIALPFDGEVLHPKKVFKKNESSPRSNEDRLSFVCIEGKVCLDLLQIERKGV